MSDDTYIIDNEDVLSVLETSCMLQFEHIQMLCLNRVTEMLYPHNCIKIWTICDALGFKILSMHAKNMALTEFNQIKQNMDSLLELNIRQLYSYLSNVYLVCDNEMDVFIVAMNWWYENCNEENKLLSGGDRTRSFLCLLSCIDFNKLPISDVREMMTYHDIKDNRDIMEVLKYLIRIREHHLDDEGNNNFKVANSLLDCKRRKSHLSPCIIVENYEITVNTDSRTFGELKFFILIFSS